MSLAHKSFWVGRKKFVEYLRAPIHSHIKNAIAQNFMYDEETQKALGRYFFILREVIFNFNKIIDDLLTIAKVIFEEKNPDKYMEFQAICCRVKDPLRCGTCLGKHQLHYPYIYIYDKLSRKGEEKKVRDWREFLKEYGLTDEQIDILFETMERRALTLQILYHHSIQWLHYIGATDRTV